MARRNYSFNPDEQLSEICTELWSLDENAAQPGVDYEVDLQGYVTSARQVRGDWAHGKLFSWLAEDAVFEKPTFKAFYALLNNYETETGRPEVVTSAEEAENWHFLDIIMETAVMQRAHAFLVERGKAPEELQDFKQRLYDIWFKLYRRQRAERCLDSSGFEHVFVGETRDRDVIGFHNWVQFYLQEKVGHIDYHGFFRRGTDEDSPRLVTLQFTWKGQSKPIGSSFIGTSPEFEIALYTIVFLMNQGHKVQILIADYEVEVACYRHGHGIGTAYPISKCD